MRRRSSADSRADWFNRVISSVSDCRFATVPSTARRSRSVLICACSASRWTTATAVTVVSSRATEAASYSRWSPPLRPAGGSAPMSDQ